MTMIQDSRSEGVPKRPFKKAPQFWLVKKRARARWRANGRRVAKVPRTNTAAQRRFRCARRTFQNICVLLSKVVRDAVGPRRERTDPHQVPRLRTKIDPLEFAYGFSRWLMWTNVRRKWSTDYRSGPTFHTRRGSGWHEFHKLPQMIYGYISMNWKKKKR